MREEVRGTRMTGEGLRTTHNIGKEEECSTWNKQEARKNHLEGGGFGVMKYNKNGRFRKIHMVELTS